MNKPQIDTKYMGSIPSSNYGTRPSGSIIDSIVIHDTVTSTFQEALDIFQKPGAQVSVHYLIDLTPSGVEGTYIYQLLDDQVRAYHAGVSYWAGKSSLNNTSIGIELVNQGDMFFPYKQIKQLAALIIWLKTQHPGIIIPQNIVSHTDITPGRKYDPNCQFDWGLLHDELAIYPELYDKCGSNKVLIDNDTTNPAYILNMKQRLSEVGYKVDIQNPTYDDSTKDVFHSFNQRFAPETFRAEIMNSDQAMVINPLNNRWYANSAFKLKRLYRKGIDVSSHQGVIDWKKVKTSGLEYAVCRMSDGATFTDNNFVNNWSGMKENNITRGVYHFFEPTSSSPDQQFEHITTLLTANGYDYTQDFFVIAVRDKGADKTVTANNLNNLINYMLSSKMFGGKYPYIFTSVTDWKSVQPGLHDKVFSTCPLWIDDKDSTTWQPAIPDLWQANGWVWREYSLGPIAGIAGNVPLNYIIQYPNQYVILGGTSTNNTGNISKISVWVSEDLINWFPTADIDNISADKGWLSFINNQYFVNINRVGIYQSMDYGTTWNKVYNHDSNEIMTSGIISYQSTLYISLKPNRFIISKDGGTTWSIEVVESACTGTSIANYNNTLFRGYDNSMCYTTDGEKFTVEDSKMDLSAWSMESAGEKLWAVGPSVSKDLPDFIISSIDGLNWSKHQLSDKASNVLTNIYTDNSNVIIVTGDSARVLYISIDAGGTFNNKYDSLSAAIKQKYSIVISRIGAIKITLNGIIYAIGIEQDGPGIPNSYIGVSSDSGNSWSIIGKVGGIWATALI